MTFLSSVDWPLIQWAVSQKFSDAVPPPKLRLWWCVKHDRAACNDGHWRLSRIGRYFRWGNEGPQKPRYRWEYRR